MTYLLDDKISYDDTLNLTAFGRLRTSQARLLGEYRYMYGSATTLEMNDKLEGNATITVDYPRDCALANITSFNGDRVVRQTKQYHPYISGTTTLNFITFVMNTAKANLVQQVGAFDDSSGFFFRMNGTTPEVVVRKNGVDNAVSNANWNIDRLDGSMNEFNKSGITLDYSKGQILNIDYQWLGLGRVRFGFVVDGTPIHVHSFNHANHVTEVYTTQPSLPLRWEIKNTGQTTSNSQLMMVCGAAYAEGGDAETGFLRSISTGNVVVNVTNANSLANSYGIIAVRLKNNVVGKQNKSLARLKNFTVTSDYDLNYRVVILQGKSSLGNANIAWSNVAGPSWCEYIKDFSLTNNWEANALVIEDNFATGDGNKKLGINPSNPIDSRTSTIYQNYDSTDSQILAIVGRNTGTDVAARASIQWLEVK